MERGGSSKKKAPYNDYGFMDLIFSWSIEDILDEDLYKNKVEKVGLSFRSVTHYLGSYKYPLLEETRAALSSSMELIHQAPYGRVVGLKLAKPFNNENGNETDNPSKNKLYNLKIEGWKNRFIRGEPYKTLPGDVLVLADFKPESTNDLQRFGRMWSFLTVVRTEDENESDKMDAVCLKVKASKDLDLDELRYKPLFIVFLTNVGSYRKAWSGLHMTNGNLKLVKQILCNGDDEVKGSCDCTSVYDATWDDCSYQRLSSDLNEAQNNAISNCLSGIHCSHNATVKLVWGPPGTGKTKTLGTMLFILMKMKYRILVCAPTNVAIKEVASRVLHIARESQCSAGDMLLFGNNDRLDVGSEEIEDIFLDNRVRKLRKCLSSFTGWRNCLISMIHFFKSCASDYKMFIENEILKLTKPDNKSYKLTSFLDFLRERFLPRADQLKDCISMLCTHVPMCIILEHNYWKLVYLNAALESFQKMLFQENLSSDELKMLFSNLEMPVNSSLYFKGTAEHVFKKRNECLSALETVKDSLDRLKLKRFTDDESVSDFCFKNSSIIFCTASSSFRLHTISMKPINLLVIDEAAQLKECESIVPLLLPRISHAILVGDECQLPSMVRSNVCSVAGFGRSLFERLSLLGSPKNLLNTQHRMHPEISLFPNSYFYSNKINDSPNVQRNYCKKYLPGPMFGAYSFINVAGGREEFDDDGRSYKNIAEVAVVMTILKNLHKVWLAKKEKLSIGIVSPYAGQVLKIQEKLAMMNYSSHDGFNVNVKSIDGFQGGEQDIIILSTVRTNYRTSLQFISSPQRTNVALTRARYCLWILGNERALVNNNNVWRALVIDSKNRGLFFSTDQNPEMAKAVLDSMKELDQSLDLLDTNSAIFRNTMWKVYFTDQFRKSFQKVRQPQSKISVINVLERLANGWRPRGRTVELVCENSSKILKQFKVESRYIICSIEIVKDFQCHVQVLKMWDIVRLEDIPKLAKSLDSEFRKYTDEYILCCKENGFDGKIECPLSWPRTANIPKFKSVGANNTEESDLVDSEDAKNAAENSTIEESTLLMKFCALSPDHMRTGRDDIEVDLPFELTDEQRNIVIFPRSTFVLGRSGTGKTTALKTKLIQNEKSHHVAVERVYGPNYTASESNEIDVELKRPILRQLFVTLSHGLCQEIKYHVSCFKRSIGENGSIDEDINDSFSDVPTNLYPLVITFHKFLLMLDLTLGNSYIKRFSDLKNQRKKEVSYERFYSLYWPHFKSQLIKKLDSYLVFTEIMSRIKGSIKAAECGKLSREDYCSLSESRALSSLSMETREMIYDIFQNYEKMKMQKGEFDIADIVIDLHRRLRTEKYKGDVMNFVFIDEVQDLTMAQILLFKHICRNVEEGFVFCGDTAQTIGRGIDFRFQDVRSLFFNKFVLESKNQLLDKKNEKRKGCISDIFMLSENFSTHAEVLKLSQSVIELLFHFFPNSIDMLKVETSLVYGESPIVIQSRNGENPILTIFGGNGYNGGNIGGFREDQVILVRDDSSKEEIMHLVGKQALVLTILECKGLQFKDVLLYNFFASSPLERRWGIIYEYMKEKNMLDPRSRVNCQSFVDSKHNVLCSELKQLYVALTRARKRLWICEDVEEFSKPMFSYWEKKNLVQFKILNSSLVETMKVEG